MDDAGLETPGVEFALTAGLLTFHRMQNRALGIEIDTRFTTLLLKESFRTFNSYQETIAQKIVKKAIISGYIKGYAQKIQDLVSEAKTPEQKREIYSQVLDMKQKQDQLLKLFEEA